MPAAQAVLATPGFLCVTSPEDVSQTAGRLPYTASGLSRPYAVAQRVERWTCDQQVVRSNATRGKSCVTTLGKLFTPMCLCHQAV